MMVAGAWLLVLALGGISYMLWLLNARLDCHRRMIDSLYAMLQERKRGA